jgi:glycosyltransferase involved in cell wall biosynthesis
MPRFSVVIPAFNEQQHLPGLLDSIDTARHRYRHGADQVEVIVADNASTDRTAEVASGRGCRTVRVLERSIAATRNAGAQAARGDILAFVDADSAVHPDTFNAIDHTLTDRVIAGATGIRMSRSSPGIALSMLVVTAVMRLGGIDSGVVFCRRADWQAVGGYNEARLWAEDVQFLFDLKRLGRGRGQRFARAARVRTVTSARKFDTHGDWHYFTTLLRSLAWSILDHSAFKRFARSYWYDRK